MPHNSLRHIMLIAGEASGDRHGANLINSLKTKNQDIRFTGLGGPFMRGAGQEQLYDIKDLAVMGLTEVLKNIFFFREVFKNTLNFIKRERPDALVLIDYPGFNVRLAEKVHRENMRPFRNPTAAIQGSKISNGVKVIYYISPQVWAWGRKRVEKIGKAIDTMLVVFHFEEDIYAKEGIPVSFVGHPLMDELALSSSREDARREHSLNSKDLVIGILPGSRLQEIKLVLPIMLKTALLLKEKFNARFMLPLAPGISRELIEREIFRRFHNDEGCFKIVDGESLSVISASDLVITASGTATLETAIMERPMVIVYKVPFLSYLVLRRIIKLPCIGMVNILLMEKAFPEFIQYEAKPQNIFKACTQILEDNVYKEKMIENSRKIKSLLGGPGAGLRAADEVWRVTCG